MVKWIFSGSMVDGFAKTTDEEVKNILSEKYEGSRWARNPQKPGY